MKPNELSMAQKIENWKVSELEAGNDPVVIELTRMEAIILLDEMKEWYWSGNAPSLTLKDIKVGNIEYCGMTVKLLEEQ